MCDARLRQVCVKKCFVSTASTRTEERLCVDIHRDGKDTSVMYSSSTRIVIVSPQDTAPAPDTTLARVGHVVCCMSGRGVPSLWLPWHAHARENPPNQPTEHTLTDTVFDLLT